MRRFILTALFVSSSSFANTSNMQIDSCNIELNAGVKIQENLLEFSQDNAPIYSILNDRYLIIDGKQVSLDPSQQSLVTEYSQSIRAIVPEIKSIAIDSVDLAIEGVSLAFGGLLGDGNQFSLKVKDELGAIRSDIDTYYDEKSFEITENGEIMTQVFGGDFEQRIETVVETLVEESMGHLLIALGKEMLWAGGDTEAFEARMEAFAEELEMDMDAKAQMIEARAETMCDSIKQIDFLEEQLKQEIKAFPLNDVIQTESLSYRKQKDNSSSYQISMFKY